MSTARLRNGWAEHVQALVEAQGRGACARILVECAAREPWVQACALWRRGRDPGGWSCLVGRGDEALLHGQAFIEDVAAGRASHDLVPGRGVLLAGQAAGALALSYAGAPQSEVDLDLLCGLLHVARLVGAADEELHDEPVEALVPALPLARSRAAEAPECQPAAELRRLLEPEIASCARSRTELALEIEQGLEASRIALSADDFGHVIRNLVSNARAALEQVPEGGRIRVSLREYQYGTLLLAVEDSGPGLPEEVREALRASGPEALPGPGLGLALSWSIALGAGGALRAAALATEGARIEIELPARAPL